MPTTLGDLVGRMTPKIVFMAGVPWMVFAREASNCQLATRPRHRRAILPFFLMAIRDIHGLFGLKPPAPPKSTWHDRMWVRHELRGITPHRPFAWIRLVRHLPFAAMIVGGILIIAVSRLLPEEVVLGIATATLIAGLLVAVINYPSICSALFGSRPITAGQIAAFAELTPSHIWERVRAAIEEQIRLPVGPLSFAGVAFEVRIAASRAAAEDRSSSQSQLRRQQAQALKLAEPAARL